MSVSLRHSSQAKLSSHKDFEKARFPLSLKKKTTTCGLHRGLYWTKGFTSASSSSLQSEVAAEHHFSAVFSNCSVANWEHRKQPWFLLLPSPGSAEGRDGAQNVFLKDVPILVSLPPGTRKYHTVYPARTTIFSAFQAKLVAKVDSGKMMESIKLSALPGQRWERVPALLARCPPASVPFPLAPSPTSPRARQEMCSFQCLGCCCWLVLLASPFCTKRCNEMAKSPHIFLGVALF